MTLLQSTRFSVPDMSGGSCKARILRALDVLDGVQGVEVLLDRREVIVHHDILEITREELGAALERAHYPGAILSEAGPQTERVG
jgi:copper chaperone CopZ